MLERRSHRGAAVYWLTIENERRLNCLGAALIDELGAAVGEVERCPDARALVLTGAGARAFVGGADLRELEALDQTSAVRFITALHLLIAALRALPVPVLARVDGYCLGAGLELAIGCDVRIASAGSTFGMPEVLVGVPSVIEAALLPRLIGAGRARDLVLSGRTIDAATAEQWGLVTEVVVPAELDAAVERTLERWLAAGREALRAQRELCRVWEEEPLREGVEAGIRAFGLSTRTGEAKSLIRQFFSRGKNRQER